MNLLTAALIPNPGKNLEPAARVQPAGHTELLSNHGHVACELLPELQIDIFILSWFQIGDFH